jgi:hypothetical protein
MDTLDALMLRLDATAKHWTLKVQNRRGSEDDPAATRRYECTVWAHGRRFTVNRMTPLLAVKAALHQMEGKDKRGLRLAQ